MCSSDLRKKQNLIERDDRVEPVDSIAKSGCLVYSIDVAILLRVRELPELGGSSPFFATIPSFRAVPDQTCS